MQAEISPLSDWAEKCHRGRDGDCGYFQRNRSSAELGSLFTRRRLVFLDGFSGLEKKTPSECLAFTNCIRCYWSGHIRQGRWGGSRGWPFRCMEGVVIAHYIVCRLLFVNFSKACVQRKSTMSLFPLLEWRNASSWCPQNSQMAAGNT